MTTEILPPPFVTSTGTTMSGSAGPRTGTLPRVAIAGLCFASFTFGSAVALEDAGASTFVQTQQNVSHLPDERLTTGEQVSALKEQSGLTWGQVADLFGVSRRAVHFWVEGGNMAAYNVARLQHLQMELAYLVGATPADVRKGLFTLDDGRSTPYARLIDEVNPSGPRLLTGPPVSAVRPPLSIAPTIPVGTVDIPGPRPDRE
jgi:DNA-binding transcriptional regulator YiaG